MMRREINDYDTRIKADQEIVQDAAPTLAEHGEIAEAGLIEWRIATSKASSHSSTSQLRLAARLKRDAPAEWRAYMAGCYLHRDRQAARCLPPALQMVGRRYPTIVRFWTAKARTYCTQ